MKPDCVINIIASNANQRLFFTPFFVIVNPLTLLVGVVVKRHYQSCQLTWYWPVTAALQLRWGENVIINNNTISDSLGNDCPVVVCCLGQTATDTRCR